MTIELTLQRAIEAHRTGKLQDAELLYRAILQTQPKHPDANHNLGILAVSVNQLEVGLSLFETALEANPEKGQFWISYIDALVKDGQFEHAQRALEQAKRLGLAVEHVKKLINQQPAIISEHEPAPPNAKKSRKFTQQSNQVPAKKEKKIHSLINQKGRTQIDSPSQTDVNDLLEHYQEQRYDVAEKLARSIIQRVPNHQLSWKVLAAALKQTGKLLESLSASQTAVKIVPKDAEAHYNLGNTLQELGRTEEAEASFRKALTFKPDFALANYNLGNALKELGRLDEAALRYRKAIALKPDHSEAHYM